MTPSDIVSKVQDGAPLGLEVEDPAMAKRRGDGARRRGRAASLRALTQLLGEASCLSPEVESDEIALDVRPKTGKRDQRGGR